MRKWEKNIFRQSIIPKRLPSAFNLVIIFIILFIVSAQLYLILRKPKNKNTQIQVAVPELIQEEEIIPGFPDETIKLISYKIDSLMERANKRYDFHGSILVAKNGKELYSKIIGYADFSDKSLIYKHSAFQLASVSKQFTAAAILMLCERGAIQLEDTITKYFPSLPYDQITIRQLLNHTSGLAKYFWLAEHKWDKEIPPTNIEVIDLMAKENLSVFFRSGAIFDYSNTGYLILASIVEEVSGMKFGDFVEKNIFAPLDMKDSFVYSFAHDSIHKNQLAGYRLYRRRYHIEIPGTVNDAVVGDKNVYSTADDLLKWINGLNNYKLIKKKALEKMYTKGETRYGRKISYGFGFRINDRKSELEIYHDGKWNGFRNSIKQYPDNELVIVFLEHTSYSSPNSIINKIRSIVEDNSTIPFIKRNLP